MVETIAPISGTNHVHDFDPSAAVAQSDLLMVGTGTAPASLAWSDPLGGSSNDYDLYILNSTLTTIITSSTNVQTGTQDPYEQTSVTVAANRRAVILQKAGAANRFLHLDTIAACCKLLRRATPTVTMQPLVVTEWPPRQSLCHSPFRSAPPSSMDLPNLTRLPIRPRRSVLTALGAAFSREMAPLSRRGISLLPAARFSNSLSLQPQTVTR
jgi:hypothetical protein